MPIADARIGKHGWLAGDTISLADFTFGVQLYRYYAIEFDRPHTPHIDSYYERLQARDAYRNHVMIPFDSLRVAGA